MSSNTEVVTALNKVLARVGVAPVHSLREFDSLLLLRIFRRLFIGLPNDVLAEPRTRADHERNFNACVSHLSNSVLMMDLSHIDGAALAEADIEATRNLLEILDELHEIFQHDTVASPGRQATPPRRQRGLHSPETAPRTHSRTRTRARTSGSSRISLGDGAADDGEGSEGPVRALDNELAPWGTDEGSDAASIGRTDGIRRLPTQRAARLQPRSDASRARMRQTYGLRAQPNADLRTGRAQLGRVEYSPKGGARPARAAVPVSKHEFGGAARPRSSSAGRARPRSGGAIGGEAQGPTVRDVLRSRGGGRASSAPRARWTPTVPVALQPTTWARTMTYHGVEEDVRRLTSAMHAARARATAHVAQAKAHALGQEDGGLGYGGHEAEIAISLGTDARTGEPLAVAASASKARAAEARGDHGGAEGGGGGGGGMAGGHGEGKGAEGGNGDTGWDDDEEATYADGPTLRAYGVYSSLLKQHTAELRRADQQQRQLGQIATRNALRDERIAWLRSQRAVSELATREASLLSHRWVFSAFVVHRYLPVFCCVSDRLNSLPLGMCISMCPPFRGCARQLAFPACFIPPLPVWRGASMGRLLA